MDVLTFAYVRLMYGMQKLDRRVRVHSDRWRNRSRLILLPAFITTFLQFPAYKVNLLLAA